MRNCPRLRNPWRSSAHLLGAGLLLAAFLPLARADGPGPDLIDFNIEDATPAPNPWGGVGDNNQLQLPLGGQLEADDTGRVVKGNFSPSIAVGDLNGDGLPDIVAADGHGFIWFFPNVGTKNKAAFKSGEVLPIWFGSTDYTHVGYGWRDLVPRIQLIDFNGDGKLDLVAGTFDGRLYMLPNTGSPTQPAFHQPDDISSIEVPTRDQDVLWCNYLAPVLCSFGGRAGLFDLVMGEGTYSANSIYLLHNQNGGSKPIFNQSHTEKIVVGNGREHLTPRVVDWFGDGKLDIVCGERQGYIDLFKNTSTDPEHPTFDQGTHIKLGGQEQFGELTTVDICDLNGNGKPNILFSNDTGVLYYATNTGTAGNPQFEAPQALTGVNPYPHIYQVNGWDYFAPFGNSYEQLVATAADVEKGFQPPPDHKGRFAMRAYVVDSLNKWFPTRYSIDANNENWDNEHMLMRDPKVPIVMGARYEITFNVKAVGPIQNARWFFDGREIFPNGSDQEVRYTHDLPTSESWNNVDESFSIDPLTEGDHSTVDLAVGFRWNGDGSFYIDDLTLHKKE